MLIAIIKNNLIEKFGEHHEIFSNVSFPRTGPSIEWLQKNSAKEIISSKELPNTSTKLVNVDPYIDSDGKVYSVNIISLTTEEINAKNTLDEINKRDSRDGLLQGSDWTQMPDSALSNSKKAEWATYRQKLRDFPTTSNWLTTEFPDPPSK